MKSPRIAIRGRGWCAFINTVINRFTATEIANHVGKSGKTIQRWIRAGKLKVRPLSDGLYECDLDELNAYAEAERTRKARQKKSQ